jgi:LysR family transcriptional regulator, glycine cleavage system transcriptional activator
MGIIPPLNGLRLFEAAARCGSFKLAAQELNLTPGAVSHGISSLEEWLDVELFDRKRDLVLTPAGLDYLSYIGEAMLMIAKGTSELQTITKGTSELAPTGQNTQDSPALPPE